MREERGEVVSLLRKVKMKGSIETVTREEREKREKELEQRRLRMEEKRKKMLASSSLSPEENEYPDDVKKESQIGKLAKKILGSVRPG